MGHEVQARERCPGGTAAPRRTAPPMERLSGSPAEADAQSYADSALTNPQGGAWGGGGGWN